MKKWREFRQIPAVSLFYHFLLFGAFLFLLVFGLTNAIDYRNDLFATSDPSLIGRDMVSTWDRMMRKIAPDLPDHGEVGYIADWDRPDFPYSHNDQTIEYILTQYALAPLTLQRGADHAVVIGNFSAVQTSQDISEIESRFNVKLIKRHTNEIYIFEGVEK